MNWWEERPLRDWEPDHVEPETGPAEWYEAGCKFCANYFLRHILVWDKYLAPWMKNNRCTSIVEIGSYEGMSACWFIMNTHGGSLVCVDTWPGGEPTTFNKNIDSIIGLRKSMHWKYGPLITVPHKEKSSKYWERRGHREGHSDLIYIDGSHLSGDVYMDVMQAWKHLREGGLLLCDDYFWTPGADSGWIAECEEVRTGIGLAFSDLGIVLHSLGQCVYAIKGVSDAEEK